MIWNQLYTLPDHNVLNVSRDADQGWEYALYHQEMFGVYELIDGGYLEGYADLSIDTVADLAVHDLELEGRPKRTCMTFAEFSEMIATRPDLTIRGVQIFLSPELKRAGIQALPADVLPRVEKAIEQRFSMPVLLIHNFLGWGFHLIDRAQAPDTTPIEVSLPDTIGLLYPDTNVREDEILEDDPDYARNLWLDPIYIDRRGDQIVFAAA